MGNDEHSQNVFRRAREAGLDPLVYCDGMEREFREVWARLDISFDDFIRTTQARHRVAVTEVVRRIADRGDLYEGFYEGPYCVSCEAFKPAKDLVDGRCPVHGTPPELIRERNHFFRLSRYQPALLEHFERHPEFLLPENRRNEILRLLEGGLDDISISRAGQFWGIPLPRRSVAASSTCGSTRSSTTSRPWASAPDDARFDAVVARGPARHRQGHHAVPLRRLARDADDRGPGPAAAGLRPRVRALQGTEDEQVARHGAGPAPGRRALRARPAAALSREGDCLRPGR